VEYDPFLKSQLASRNQLQGLVCCTFGHITFETPNQRNPRDPPCGAVIGEKQGGNDRQLRVGVGGVRADSPMPVLLERGSERESGRERERERKREIEGVRESLDSLTPVLGDVTPCVQQCGHEITALIE